jgi:hypothetical protein
VSEQLSYLESQKLDQDARDSLRRFYSEQQRQWVTNILALAAGSIAAFQGKVVLDGYGPGIFEVALGMIAGQIVYCVQRFVWYGRRCQTALWVAPDEDESGKSYIYRIDVAVTKEMRKHFIIVFLEETHGITFWVVWTTFWLLFLQLIFLEMSAWQLTFVIVTDALLLTFSLRYCRILYREYKKREKEDG